jgi:hypothetical protein
MTFEQCPARTLPPREGLAEMTRNRNAFEGCNGDGVGDQVIPAQQQETLEVEAGRESDRRRYRIIKTLFENHESGRITIRELERNRKFTRAFRRRGATTLEEDFRRIEALLGNGQPFRVTRDGAAMLRWVPAGESAFAELGYCSAASAPPKLAAETEDKRRIGELVVSELLNADVEVLYLSTGTTVYQVALALLNSERENVSMILTDNAAIVELCCQRSMTDRRLRENKLLLHLIGGRLSFNPPDIESESEFKEFKRWKCSKAVISVTGINPETGQLYSFRLPKTKEEVLLDLDVREVIIPLLPNKIGQAGGRLIHDPRNQNHENRIYRIVTTKLAPGVKAQLEKHRYEVREVDAPRPT